MSPFDALLCERGPEDAYRWERGFHDGPDFALMLPVNARQIHAVVALGLPGEETARRIGMPYDAEHEGLWHGIYGEIEYQRLAKI